MTTQSGQGEEPQLPAARPAHEGVVLPASGGDPRGAYGSPRGAYGDQSAYGDQQAVPAGGQPWGAPWGPAPTPTGQQAHQQAQPQPQQGWGSAPLPPEAAPGAAPGADADATQYIAAVPPRAPADEGATQLIPPVGNGPGPWQQPAPGALPPEARADATQYLGRVPAAPAAASTGGSDADATQYIAPVPGTAPAPAPTHSPAAPPPAAPTPPTRAPFDIRPGAPGDRQPPAEFDNLFRSEPAERAEPAGPTEPATGATQQMPRFEHPDAGPAAPPQGRAAARRSAEASGRGRTKSKAPLLATAFGVLVVLGIGGGALLSGGGSDDDSDGDNDKAKTVSASSPDADPDDEKASPTPTPTPTTDPAEKQALELDKLLADSNNSRAAVIRSVENIKKCERLGKAASDLRDAAKQRNGLVTRLSQVSIDKLPRNAELTQHLNKAWKASASADVHYAKWADQVAAKKGCPKGEARVTGQTGAGNRASGEATQAKERAARLWNAIAAKYDLPKRNKTQL